MRWKFVQGLSAVTSYHQDQISGARHEVKVISAIECRVASRAPDQKPDPHTPVSLTNYYCRMSGYVLYSQAFRVQISCYRHINKYY